MGNPKLAFALDYPDLRTATAGAERVVSSVGVLKVGLELFLREGAPAVQLGHDLDAAVFLDLKLHDIPETVARAVASVATLGVRYLTVHAAGGPKMLEQAAARARSDADNLTILAVTVLTSMDSEDLHAVGVGGSPAAQVQRLAKMAVDCGVGGLVCSPQEVAELRASLGSAPVLVTPGIRPVGGDAGDQKRTAGVAEAISAGSSLLVVGRPIRDAADPAAAAARIDSEICEALRGRA